MGFADTFAAEILSALCSLVVKSADKNTCTRALWVISKQSFPADVVGQKVNISPGSCPGKRAREPGGEVTGAAVFIHNAPLLRRRPYWEHWRACGAEGTSSPR